MPNGLSLVNLACWHVGVMKLGGRRAMLFGNWCHFMWTIQHWREIAVLRGDQIEICYDFIFLSLAFIWPWRVGVPGLDDLGFYLYLYLFYFIHALSLWLVFLFYILLFFCIYLFFSSLIWSTFYILPVYWSYAPLFFFHASSTLLLIRNWRYWCILYSQVISSFIWFLKKAQA